MEAQFSSSMLSVGYFMFALPLGGIIILLLLHLKHRSSDELPPGNLGLPFVGENLQFLWALGANKAQQFFHEREKKFGRVYKTSLTGHTTVVVCGPSGNRFILSNENKLVVLSWPSSFMKLFGRDSLSGKFGDEHRIVRAAVASFFTPSVLQNYIAKISSEIERHIDEKWKPNEKVKVLPSVREIIFSNACTLFFGLDKKHVQEQLHTVLETIILGSLSLPIDFPGTRFNAAVKARLELDEILSSLIGERRRSLSSGKASPQQDLLSALLTFKDERGDPLTQREILDNFSLLLHAGYDTTISPLSIMFKLLASHPECYQKMAEEHLRIAADKEGGEEPTWKDVKEMKYTWQCAQETLRLYPPVFGSFRKAIKDLEYEGYKIPKGCKLLWTTYSTHMNEEYFSEPDKFRPSRFEEEGAQMRPYTFLPFGGGLRKCPGWELSRVQIVLFMHHFVRSFSGYRVIDPDEKIAGNPVPPLPINGLPIQLVRRM